MTSSTEEEEILRIDAAGSNSYSRKQPRSAPKRRCTNRIFACLVGEAIEDGICQLEMMNAAVEREVREAAIRRELPSTGNDL